MEMSIFVEEGHPENPEKKATKQPGGSEPTNSHMRNRTLANGEASAMEGHFKDLHFVTLAIACSFPASYTLLNGASRIIPDGGEPKSKY
jgi:hypothetical protein